MTRRRDTSDQNEHHTVPNTAARRPRWLCRSAMGNQVGIVHTADMSKYKNVTAVKPYTAVLPLPSCAELLPCHVWK